MLYYFKRRNPHSNACRFYALLSTPSKGWFTLGPSKAELSQDERGKVFTLAIMFTLGGHASEVRRAARVYPGCLV